MQFVLMVFRVLDSAGRAFPDDAPPSPEAAQSPQMRTALEFMGALLTLRFGDALKSVGKIFSEGAFSLGALGKKVAQPLTLTAATSGGNKLGLGQAIGAGLSGGLKALKSSLGRLIKARPMATSCSALAFADCGTAA